MFRIYEENKEKRMFHIKEQKILRFKTNNILSNKVDSVKKQKKKLTSP